MGDKVSIGDCTLYFGDSLEVLPKLDNVDVVVTDPPYGTAFVGGYNRKGELIKNDDDLGVTSIVLRLAKPLCNGNAAVFYSPRIAPQFHKETHFMDWYGQIIWDKKAPGMGGALRYQHENIALFGKELPFKKAFSVYSYFRDASEHPHQKPIQVLMQLLSILDAELILDPFMGSGTTGVACVKKGKKFVGVELDAKHFDTACKRIETAYKQPDLFIEPKSKAEQVVLDI